MKKKCKKCGNKLSAYNQTGECFFHRVTPERAAIFENNWPEPYFPIDKSKRLGYGKNVIIKDYYGYCD